MVTFSSNELEFLATNAMGLSSEAGNAPVFELGLATHVNKKTYLVHFAEGNNSGYTVGVFQWDFGVKGHEQSVIELIDEYNKWAGSDNKIINIKEASRLITQHGQHYIHHKNQQTEVNYNYLQNKLDLRHKKLGHKLNEFFASEAGHTYINKLQEAQYKILERTMKHVEKQAAISSKTNSKADKNDARIMLAIVAKLKNQVGHIDKRIKKLLDNPHTTAQKLLNEVRVVYHKIKDKKTGKLYENSVYLGAKATKRGAELYNKLNADGGFLGELLKRQMLADPTLIKNPFKNNADAQILDAMFRNPTRAKRLIDAYNRGETYQIDNHSGKIKNESYTIGITSRGELYSINEQGKGFYASANNKDWLLLSSSQEIDVKFMGNKNSTHHSSHTTDDSTLKPRDQKETPATKDYMQDVIPNLPVPNLPVPVELRQALHGNKLSEHQIKNIFGVIHAAVNNHIYKIFDIRVVGNELNVAYQNANCPEVMQFKIFDLQTVAQIQDTKSSAQAPTEQHLNPHHHHSH